MTVRPLSFALAALLLAPSAVLAHEHQSFRIGTAEYEFTVGSLNEPVAVDDKTGVEVSIQKLTPDAHAGVAHEDGDEHAASTPVTGLEKTLKVELIAGNQKKMLDLTTIFGQPGSYKAVFIPTVQTTYTYRFVGSIEGTAVDLSFTCNPAGHPASPEDTTELKLSDDVTRMKKSGAFGCPMAKDALGFPEPAPTLTSLSGGSGTATATTLASVALAFSLVAFASKRKAA